MKAKYISFLFAILITSCTANNTTNLVIQNVKVFDGVSIIPNATLVVRNGMISEIKTDPNEVFENYSIIDGTGKTIIPGLINAHVHAWLPEHTEEALRSGVFTVLDLLNNDASSIKTLKDMGNSSSSHAYYYSAGNTVTVSVGHGTQFGIAPVIANVTEVPGFINDRVEEGSDYIKLMIERGGTSSPRPTLTDEMIELAIKSSKESNKVTIAHITDRSDAIKAAQFGINGLAHIWYRDTTSITVEEIEVLKKSEVFIIPTLLTWQKVNDRFGTFDMGLIKADLLALHQAGIPILAGTDPPNAQVNHGDDLHLELQLLVEVGLTPLEALKSATSIPSSSFKLGEKGFIKAGYPADFILVNGDPTINISALSKIEHIWKQGELVTQTN